MEQAILVFVMIGLALGFGWYQKKFGRARNYDDLSKLYGLEPDESPIQQVRGAFYSGPLNGVGAATTGDKMLNWLTNDSERERLAILVITNKNRLAVVQEQLGSSNRATYLYEPRSVLAAGEATVQLAQEVFPGHPALPSPADGPKAPRTFKVEAMDLVRISGPSESLLIWCENANVSHVLSWAKASRAA